MILAASRYALAMAGAGVLLGAMPAPGEAAAPSCLLIGDSTIVGTSRELQRLLGGDCAVAAKVGASTAAAEGWADPAARYDVAVIGTGSNDARSPALADRLARLRAKVKAGKVIWLAPYAQRARELVEEVAARSHDATVPLAAFPSRDGIHPANYAAVARTLAAGNTVTLPPAGGADSVRVATTASSPRMARPLRTARAPVALAMRGPAWPAPAFASSRMARVARPRIAPAAIARPTISRPMIAIAALPASGTD